ncbi:hypothetical protein [Paracoccus sp. (in: a-proteobacteria)]|uniref:hypothetical protein n=1 Tax=Paracoccus sp. TaxID=267 RepID=UPI002AFEB196|nr:hypothetical protein [Paracoccus sp. (in: a-proteobacteria)]
MIANLARLDLLDDQSLDCLLDLLTIPEVKYRLDHALAGRIFWADPTRSGIPIVTEAVEIGLRSGRSGIERAVLIELNTRD